MTWIRRKDRQLLTVGRDTHSIDKRFVVLNNPNWSLLIKNVKQEDAGLYECQVIFIIICIIFIVMFIEKHAIFDRYYINQKSYSIALYMQNMTSFKRGRQAT